MQGFSFGVGVPIHFDDGFSNTTLSQSRNRENFQNPLSLPTISILPTMNTNAPHPEGLLRDYLLCHPPIPFRNFVASGFDPSRTSYVVFRKPGTLHDLVISVKFLSEFPRGNSEFNPTPQQMQQITDIRNGAYWEHAMVSGMEWRRRMNNETSRSSSTRRSRNRQSLIVAATFTNEYGFQLVGHVEESPMSDIQFRFRTSFQLTLPNSTEALLYMTILGGAAQIYQWKPRDEETTPNNLIGIIAAQVGKLVESRKEPILSLKALADIAQNNDVEKTIQAMLPSLPPPPKLGKEIRHFLRHSFEPKHRLLSYLQYRMWPFCQPNIATPNPLGPFVKPYLFMKLKWAPGPLDGRPPMIPNRSPRASTSIYASPSPRRRSTGIPIASNNPRAFASLAMSSSPRNRHLGISVMASPAGFGQQGSPRSYANASISPRPLDTVAVSPFPRIRYSGMPVTTPPQGSPRSLSTITNPRVQPLPIQEERQDSPQWHTNTSNPRLQPLANDGVPIQEERQDSPQSHTNVSNPRLQPFANDCVPIEVGRASSPDSIMPIPRALSFCQDDFSSATFSSESSSQSSVSSTDVVVDEKFAARSKLREKRRRWIRREKRRNRRHQETIARSDTAAKHPSNVKVQFKTNEPPPRREQVFPQIPLVPSSADIAINLLCPYMKQIEEFVVSGESPRQQALRYAIETSLFCNHLRGRFVLEFVPKVPMPGYPPSRKHYQWEIRKAN